MRNSVIIFALCYATISWHGAMSGPISKWSDRPNYKSFETNLNIYDVERCLLDLTGAGGIPTVYSQPDRPEYRMLVWEVNDVTTGRIDLHKSNTGTKITIWGVYTHDKSGVDNCLR